MQVPPLDAADDITLVSLRKNSDVTWSRAYPILWKAVMSSVVAKLGPTGGDVENLCSDILCKEVIPGVLDPQTESFRQLRSFQDLLQVSRAIARNRAIDFIRRRVRRPEDLHAEVPETSDTVAEDTAGPDLLELIQLHLNPPDPELFHDRFVLGLTTREIAEKRNLPHGQVCSRFARALKSLAGILQSGRSGGVDSVTA